MKKSRLHSPRDYMALLVRQKWLVLSAFVVAAGLAVLFSMIVPDIYTSQTMILIQPRDVPTDFVKDLISGSTDQRLSAIEKTILSRTNLLKILNEFEAGLTQYRGLNDERKVIKLKKKIHIDFPSEKVRGTFLPITNVTISYSDHSPDLAQKITGRLATLFIEQDNRAREEQVFGTTEFLTGELNKVTAQLRQSEEKLKVLKEHYRYELPGELETNLRTLDRLQLQRNANVEALDRQVSLRLTMERQISETPPTIPREQAVRMGSPATQTAPNPIVEAYRKKEQEYKELVAKATDKHPQVQRLKAELEQLKKDLPPEPLETPLEPQKVEAAPAMAPNPVYQNLLSQLQQVKTEIQIREREKKWIDAEMERYNQRVQNTPQVEQQIAAALRTNDDLNKQNEDLKTKLSQAKLAESLESRQKGTQFVVVDPASYPLEPDPPSRPVLLLAGLAISLAVGFGAAIVVDVASQKVYTEPELERALESYVLIEIPRIITPCDLARARRLKIAYAAAFVVCACVYGGCLYYLYVRQAALLRLLDPLIERIRS